jgi:hypothetical protein
MKRIKPCKKSHLEQTFPCRHSDKIYWDKRDYEDDFGVIEPEEEAWVKLRRCRRKRLAKIKHLEPEQEAAYFPCNFQGTRFRDFDEWKEYQKMREAKTTGNKKYRKRVIRKANKRLEKSQSTVTKRKANASYMRNIEGVKTSPRVRFA